MPITNADCGVWTLDEVYLKINANRWVCYNTANDPGSLWAWGNNDRGVLGQNDTVNRSSPVQISGTSWLQVDAGLSVVPIVLARKSDNTLWGWGDNLFGGLGQNDQINRSSPIQIPGTTWTDVTVGSSPLQCHSVLALKSDDRDYAFWAWGFNGVGALGDNTILNRSSPVQIIGGTGWCAISAGTESNSSFGIKTDNTLWAWGQNNQRQLGLGAADSTNRSSPVQIPGTSWVEVLTNNSNTLARKSDGTLWAWGRDQGGLHGLNGTVSNTIGSPVQIPGNVWTQVATGGRDILPSSAARKSDGTLWVWGQNNQGQLGVNDRVYRSSPVQVPGTSWVDVSMGCNNPGSGGFTLARKSDGTLWSWGGASYGQLGDSTVVNKSSPVQVPGTSWVEMIASSNRTHARKSDNTLWTWGRSYLGVANSFVSSPIQIPGTAWVQVSSGSRVTTARKSDGTLWAWGSNMYCQLATDPVIVSSTTPVQLIGSNWTDIEVGQRHSLARKSDNTLWSWGYNQSGQLGLNNTTLRSSPTISAINEGWSCIEGIGAISVGIRPNGTLWVWGQNNSGQLGQNNTVFRSSPVQVPGTSWVEVTGGSTHIMARKSDNTLWGWGISNNGQLGQNDRVTRSSPVQIPGTGWTQISGGVDHAIGRKSDGTLWAWGLGIIGQLGQNDAVSRSSPVQVPGTAWVETVGGNCHTMARKSDGTLWVWGSGSSGGLGQNDTISRSSPVQVPGTEWIRLGRSFLSGSLAIKSNS